LRRLTAAAGELLLEEAADHRPGHGLRDEAVPEGLNGERLTVGDLPRSLPARRDVVHPEVGADAAGVHEREIGVTEVVGRGCRQLRVRDHVAER